MTKMLCISYIFHACYMPHSFHIPGFNHLKDVNPHVVVKHLYVVINSSIVKTFDFTYTHIYNIILF